MAIEKPSVSFYFDYISSNAYLELHLAGEDPLDSEALSKWLAAPQPSAMRRRFRS